MSRLRTGIAFALVLASVGCGNKKTESTPAGSGSAAATASTSGLAWTPEGYEKLSASCKKDLACCEEIAKADGAKSAMDFNGKCSGPAMWKDAECDLDLKSRVSMLESGGKPVPAACK
jgi:hypothetical protein